MIMKKGFSENFKMGTFKIQVISLQVVRFWHGLHRIWNLTTQLIVTQVSTIYIEMCYHFIITNFLSKKNYLKLRIVRDYQTSF